MPRHYAWYGGLFALAVLIAGLVIFVSAKWPPHASAVSSASGQKASSAAAVSPPPDTKLYQNRTYQFSLYYPDDLSVSEQPGAAGSMVLLFQDQTSGQGFDIFIVPYDEPKITQATFLMDKPSGVMQYPQDITIDGAPATEFLSTNPAMGASREIWFLHGGFLYEVTTPQPLDGWLLQIMQTWQFT